jgi:hypothetical protein
VSEIERVLVAWYLLNERRRLYLRFRRRLEAIAYAPGWESKP